VQEELDLPLPAWGASLHVYSAGARSEGADGIDWSGKAVLLYTGAARRMAWARQRSEP
jgi:hypothetical protein